jgi:hypothetical protein
MRGEGGGREGMRGRGEGGSKGGVRGKKLRRT